MNLRASVSAIVLACTAGGAGCAATGPEPQWVDSEIYCPSEQVLWEFLLLSLDKTGFPKGIGTDPNRRTIDTGWRISLAPFKGKGWREKASVVVERIESGRYEVRVRVERETNEDLLRPLDPSFAQWEPTDDNVEHAQHVLTFLESFIGNDLDLDSGQRVRRDPDRLP